VIYFPAFYPDYSAEAKTSDPTAEVKDPAYVYQVYYQGQLLGMNVLKAGEELTIDEYTVLFENPRHYTLLAVKRDRFTFLVLLGGVILLAGLILAFWMIPRKIWAVREDNEWTVCGASLKNGILFREKFDQAAKDTGFEPSRPGEDHTRKENM
jgi:cytochrome c biogenesis protein ResB